LSGQPANAVAWCADNTLTVARPRESPCKVRLWICERRAGASDGADGNGAVRAPSGPRNLERSDGGGADPPPDGSPSRCRDHCRVPDLCDGV